MKRSVTIEEINVSSDKILTEFKKNNLSKQQKNEVMKFLSKNDQKLAIASALLKNNVKHKYFCISHSYPYCAIAESDYLVGFDIEVERNITNFKQIINNYFTIKEKEYIGSDIKKFFLI
jgi:phosphopantetheinyl transferase